MNGEETRLKVEVFRQLLMQYNGPITPMMQANREWLGTQWHLSRDEQLALLGSVDASTYQRWLADITRGQIPSLPENVISRLEVLLGVEKSLEILVPENRPDLVISWFNTPNKNPLFQGKSIKQYLLDNNNLDAFHALEAYLVDAVIGFLSGSYT